MKKSNFFTLLEGNGLIKCTFNSACWKNVKISAVFLFVMLFHVLYVVLWNETWLLSKSLAEVHVRQNSETPCMKRFSLWFLVWFSERLVLYFQCNNVLIWSVWCCAPFRGDFRTCGAFLTLFDFQSSAFCFRFVVMFLVAVERSLFLCFSIIVTSPSDPLTSVASSDQWCWSGLRGNVNRAALVTVVLCSCLWLHEFFLTAYRSTRLVSSHNRTAWVHVSLVSSKQWDDIKKSKTNSKISSGASLTLLVGSSGLCKNCPRNGLMSGGLSSFYDVYQSQSEMIFTYYHICFWFIVICCFLFCDEVLMSCRDGLRVCRRR